MYDSEQAAIGPPVARNVSRATQPKFSHTQKAFQDLLLVHVVIEKGGHSNGSSDLI